MAATDATRLLRAGLLDGVTVLLARAAEGTPGTGTAPAAAVHAACAALGANVIELSAAAPPAASPFEEEELEAELDRAPGAARAIDLAVIDAAGLYAAASATAEPGAQGAAREALRACSDGAWNVARACANRAFLEPGRPGRILFIAPAPGAGEHAGAAAAALENLARTLSIEWARHRVTPVALAPADTTAAGEVAGLAAYLASPAGAYFSGCLLDLRGDALSRSSRRTGRP
jgi:NAD(P)-dependent dehydrogenase (short-subunit alcohol dehydrogenase family)